jgi:serine/threonine protein kinase
MGLEVEFDKDWTSISKECKDLIKKLLMKNPKERITLENALQHEWFNSLDINKYTG